MKVHLRVIAFANRESYRGSVNLKFKEGSNGNT